MGESDGNADQGNHATMREISPRLAEDQFYRALASAHRRRLLYHLLENGESTAEELASVLSGWEVSSTGTMYTQADHAAILTQLRHNHLPRLAEADLIAYDTDTGTVQLASVDSLVKRIIRQSVEVEHLDAPG